MTHLVRPSPHHYAAWADAVRNFEPGGMHGSGLPDRRCDDPSRRACDEAIAKARQYADTSAPLPEGMVHADSYWITDRDPDETTDVSVVGFLQLRHELNDFLVGYGGHIGYSVRPSRRREGHATRALGLALDRARALGLSRVLLTCADDNAGSCRTIEAHGGVVEDLRPGPPDDPGPIRRYWIDL